MLALTLVDDVEGQASEVRRRIAAVESVRDPALVALRNCILRAFGASPDP